MIGLFFYILAILYAYVFFRFYRGLNQVVSEPIALKERSDKITIVVAFRNEEVNLDTLLASLAKQSLQGFQLVLVNDHSSDNFIPVIDKWSHVFQDFSLLHLENERGKKYAIAQGVIHAKSDNILVTDADCSLPADWAKTMSHSLSKDTEVKLVAGIVSLSGDSFFQRLQQLEFSSLIASSVGSANQGLGFMLNAASMGFKKSFYLDVMDELLSIPSPSGDDIFLLSACKRNYRNGFRYISDSSILVTTPAKTTLRSFMSQRIRWASKTAYYNDSVMTQIAILVGITHLTLFFGAIGSFFFVGIAPPFIMLLTVKLIIDFVLLFRYLRGIQQLYLLNYFLIVEFLLPFYIIFVGISSQFVKYTWKDRSYSH